MAVCCTRVEHGPTDCNTPDHSGARSAGIGGTGNQPCAGQQRKFDGLSLRQYGGSNPVGG